MESTPVGTKMSDAKISPLESTPVGTKTSDPKTLQLIKYLSKRKEKRKMSTYQRIRSQTQVSQTHHQENLIHPMTSNIENQKSNDVMERKSIGNARNRSRQTHRRATLIRLTKFIIKSRFDKRKIIRKRNRILSNYAQN